MLRKFKSEKAARGYEVNIRKCLDTTAERVRKFNDNSSKHIDHSCKIFHTKSVIREGRYHEICDKCLTSLKVWDKK